MVCIWDVYNMNNIFVFFIFFYNFETFIKNITVLIQYMSTNQVYFSKIEKSKTFFLLGGLGVEPGDPLVPAGDGSQYTMGMIVFPCRKWYSF